MDMKLFITFILMGIISALSIMFFIHIGISFILSLILVIIESCIISSILQLLLKLNK